MRQKADQPHSEENESAVLAAILLSPGTIEPVGELLEKGDFYFEKHQVLYEVMKELWGAGKPIDMRTVQSCLELRNAFDLVGGVPFLTSLDLYLPDISRVMDYAEVVKERSARRQLLKVAQDVTSACHSSGLEAKEIVTKAEKSLGGIWVGESSEWVSVREAFEENDQIRKDQREGRIPTVATGVYALDAITGPIEAGEVIVVGGNPKMGKSSFARQLLLNFSKYGPVLFATLEEPVNQVAPKMACSLADVSFFKWRNDEMSFDEQERYHDARQELIERDVRFVGVGSGKKQMAPNWPALKRILRKASKKKLVACAVDFIQKLTESKDTVWELKMISNELSLVSLDLKIVSILVSQLNRGNARRTNKKAGETEKWEDHIPQIADFEGSGGIEQAGHKLVFPMRPAYFEPNNLEFKSYGGMEKAKIILAANRNGPIGTAEVWWKGSTMSFWDTKQQEAASW